jgi:hypothetical protein
MTNIENEQPFSAKLATQNLLAILIHHVLRWMIKLLHGTKKKGQSSVVKIRAWH